MSRALPTDTQARALVTLAQTIRDAVDDGQQVPCVTNPRDWDEPLSPPSLCDPCPLEVLNACKAYADTGAVKHGIVAGRRMAPSRSRGSSSPSTHSNVAAAQKAREVSAA